MVVDIIAAGLHLPFKYSYHTKYLFRWKILNANDQVGDLTEEGEGTRVTATDNQMLRAVWPHHRSLNNGKAPLQVKIWSGIYLNRMQCYLCYNNPTLCPTRCHWLPEETCAMFIWICCFLLLAFPTHLNPSFCSTCSELPPTETNAKQLLNIGKIKKNVNAQFRSCLRPVLKR